MRPLLIAIVLCFSAPLGAQTYVETFDGGTNAGGWTFGLPQLYPVTGGNPGEYLRVNTLDTFAPQPRTIGSSIFTGDYRARGVTTISVDLIQLSQGTTGGRPCSIMLYDDQGTPSVNDDVAAYFLGPNIPSFGAGWQTYTFNIPSQDMTLPPGWALFTSGAPGVLADWNTIIQNVTQVRFFYGDPTFFFIFQQWNLGLDNPSITETAAPGPMFSRGDCSNDGAYGLPDAIAVLNFLFNPAAGPQACEDACDINDDSVASLADVIELLSNLFSGGLPPAAPSFPDCGVDPDDSDAFDCATQPLDACP